MQSGLRLVTAQPAGAQMKRDIVVRVVDRVQVVDEHIQACYIYNISAKRTKNQLSNACLRSRIGGVGAEICLRKVK
jgi:hypothetical protein